MGVRALFVEVLGPSSSFRPSWPLASIVDLRSEISASLFLPALIWYRMSFSAKFLNWLNSSLETHCMSEAAVVVSEAAVVES